MDIRNFFEEHLKIAFSDIYVDEKREKAYRLVLDVLLETKRDDENFENDIDLLRKRVQVLLDKFDGKSIGFFERALYDWYHNNGDFSKNDLELEKNINFVVDANLKINQDKLARVEDNCFNDVIIDFSTKEKFLRVAKSIVSSQDYAKLAQRLELFIDLPVVKKKLVLFDNMINLNCRILSLVVGLFEYLRALAPYPSDFEDLKFKKEWNDKFLLEQENLQNIDDKQFGMFLSEFKNSNPTVATFVKMGEAYHYADLMLDTSKDELAKISQHFFALGVLESEVTSKKVRRRVD